MIVTLTLNPSIDATLDLADHLRRGSVHRLKTVTRQAGGKGINVAHAIHRAGNATRAVFPARNDDWFLRCITDIDLPHICVPIEGSVRTNTTITEPGGETTKLNGPGAYLDRDDLHRIVDSLVACATDTEAEWLVMAGSLPPGCLSDTYTQLVRIVQERCTGVHIAVDTSDAAMIEMGRSLSEIAPTLIKPNVLELAQLCNLDHDELELAISHGDYSTVLDAARVLHSRGVQEVLVTLGAAGAIVVTDQGAWHAASPSATVVSTVGAGDCALAGYLLARVERKSAPDCLARAVSYGAAATSLPGTAVPDPTMTHPENVAVRDLTPVEE